MKHFIMSVFLFAFVTGEAMAVCTTGTRIQGRGNVLGKLLQGYTVCKTSTNPDWVWEWQEFHQGNNNGGDLIDYKHGPSHSTDPTTTVGSWSITTIGQGNDPIVETVTYNYGSGGSYTFSVWDQGNGGPYNFCGTSSGATDVLGATLVPGSNGCGGSSPATRGRGRN